MTARSNDTRAETTVGSRKNNGGRARLFSADFKKSESAGLTLGSTNFSLYNKFVGYRRGQKTKKLTKDQMKGIEETLPCPYNPDALS